MNETLKSSRRKISSKKMQGCVATNSDGSSRFPRRQRKRGRFTTSGLISSDEISTKPAPSFQFFAMSEHGINLYVDLNSSLSEWINSIKGDVTICTEGHHPKSRNTSNHMRGLADNDEHIEIQPTGAAMKLSNDGAKRNCEYNSPLTLVVSPNHHSEACAPDPTVATSRSSMFTSSGNAVETPGGSDGNLVASSSCITHSGFQNQTTFDVASYPTGGAVLPQDSACASHCT